jgi:tRNA(Glu) U13 pseudouridine synthase TruD
MSYNRAYRWLFDIEDISFIDHEHFSSQTEALHKVPKGAYRTLLATPAGVKLMKLRNHMDNNTGKCKEGGDAERDPEGAGEVAGDGVVVEFKLKPGCYATAMLREAMCDDNAL